MFSPSTKKELQDAVNLWCKKQNEALEKYGDINSWDVSKITDKRELFKHKKNFNSDISSWDVSNVSNMSNMFLEASSFNQDISNWNTKKVKKPYNLFYNCNIKEEYKPKFL